jgi:hypothetical protein
LATSGCLAKLGSRPAFVLGRVWDAGTVSWLPVPASGTATPVGAGGSSLHTLVVDEQLRPLFAYLRALTLPTSVFAAPEDWATTELGGRIERAATELAVIRDAGVGHRIADRASSGYQHQFAGNATGAARTTADIDFNSPLMKLAAGGALGDEAVAKAA